MESIQANEQEHHGLIQVCNGSREWNNVFNNKIDTIYSNCIPAYFYLGAKGKYAEMGRWDFVKMSAKKSRWTFDPQQIIKLVS